MVIDIVRASLPRKHPASTVHC